MRPLFAVATTPLEACVAEGVVRPEVEDLLALAEDEECVPFRRLALRCKEQETKWNHLSAHEGGKGFFFSYHKPCKRLVPSVIDVDASHTPEPTKVPIKEPHGLVRVGDDVREICHCAKVACVTEGGVERINGRVGEVRGDAGCAKSGLGGGMIPLGD